MSTVLRLQAAAGNRAVAQLLGDKARVQRSHSGRSYEHCSTTQPAESLGFKEYLNVQRNAPKSAEPVKKEQRLEVLLMSLARWPAKGHKAWKKLKTSEKIIVLEQLRTRYGAKFSSDFLRYTKSGSTDRSAHYGPGYPGHTAKWFYERGYGLAMQAGTDSYYQQWWVHPSGYMIFEMYDKKRISPKEQTAPAPAENNADKDTVVDPAPDDFAGSPGPVPDPIDYSGEG